MRVDSWAATPALSPAIWLTIASIRLFIRSMDVIEALYAAWYATVRASAATPGTVAVSSRTMRSTSAPTSTSVCRVTLRVVDHVHAPGEEGRMGHGMGIMANAMAAMVAACRGSHYHVRLTLFISCPRPVPHP